MASLRGLTTACLLLCYLCQHACLGQKAAASLTDVNTVGQVEVESNDVYLDDTYYQLEGQSLGEAEVDEADDVQMDQDNMFEDDLPSEDSQRPSKEEVKELLDKENAVSRGSTYLRDFNPYVAYSASEFLTSWRCCPRKQGYGCRSYRRPMPCFYHWVNGVRQRCCTVWPQNIQYAYCNCNKCAVLTPYCASVGRCLRRYRSQRVWAVCFRPQGGWSLRALVRRIPTSCYCKTHC